MRKRVLRSAPCHGAIVFGLLLSMGGVAGAQADRTPPRLIGIKIAPAAVNVSAADVRCAIDLTLTAGSSGVAPESQRSSYWAIELTSPSGRQKRMVSNHLLKLTSGTPLDGVWSGEFIMPRFSEPGVWRVTNIHLTDGAGKALGLGGWKTDSVEDSDNGQSRVVRMSRQSPAELDMASLMVASEPFDATPPQLGSVRLDPPTIQADSPAREVTVTIGARDDLSGVSFAPGGTGSEPAPGIGVEVRSPSGNQRLTAERGFNPMSSATKWTLVSGTAQNGIWQAKLFLPKAPESGAWRVQEVCLMDTVRNMRCFGAELSGLGIPDLVVNAPISASGQGSVR